MGELLWNKELQMIILKPLHVKKTYSSTVFLRDVLSNANEQKKK